MFGGDSGFLYTGRYAEQGNVLTAQVHVKQDMAGSYLAAFSNGKPDASIARQPPSSEITLV
jgi:hypothetical protein